jgi:glycosyltransferase involved in cell wall biosynthesis
VKILHLTRDLPPRVRGGISVAVGGLVAAAATSAEQAVLSFDGWRPRAGGPKTDPQRAETHEGVPVLRVSSPEHLEEASRFAAGLDPELVIVHHAMLFEAATQLQVQAPRALFVHVVQEALSASRGLETDTLSAAAQRAALSAADVVFVPSEAAALALGSPCVVLPLGITPRVPGWGKRDPDLVLCVGRFDTAKGTADLLAAVPLVLAAQPATRFVFAGGLPDSPKSERRWRRRWIEHATPAAQTAVQFPGWLSLDEIAGLQRSAAVVVAPSHIETFGLAVLEAQQAGAALVASDIPAHRELVTPGTGVLVPAGDVKACATAIAALLSDPRRRRVLGAVAAEAARKAAWAQRIEAHLAAWRAVIERQR